MGLENVVEFFYILTGFLSLKVFPLCNRFFADWGTIGHNYDISTKLVIFHRVLDNIEQYELIHDPVGFDFQVDV